MSIFSVLNEKDNISINENNFTHSTYFNLKQDVNYYLSILSDGKIITNVSNSFGNMYYAGKTLLINPSDGKTNEMIKGMNTISHNFTLIDNHTSKEIWGVGGCGKRNKKNYTDGIYLLFSKDNMKSWKLYDNIIFAKNTKGWNPRGDSTFDSNITSFYSNILKKFIIITRYNIGAGSRGFQVFSSNHFKRGWDKGVLCKINTYQLRENYYMNKVIEIEKYKIFLMVAPFSDMKRRSKSGLKILISYNLVNWIDCGILKEAKAVESHSSTPDIQPVSVKFNSKTNIISIFYHDHYFSKTPSTIFKMDCDINKVLSVIYRKKIIPVNIEFLTRMIKFNFTSYDSEQTTQIVLELDGNKYEINKQNTIELPNSIELNKKYKCLITIHNAIFSGFSFI